MIHTPRRLITNSFIYTAALVLQRLIAAVYFWYYSNHLPGGAADLGRVQFVLSFVALFFIIGDLGLYQIFLRETSRSPEKTNQYLNTLLTLKLPLISLASLIILVITILQFPQDLSLIIVALIWIIFDNLNILFYGILRSRQMMQYESAALVVYQLVVMTIGIVAIKLSGSVFYIILSLAVGTLLNFIFVFNLLIFKLRIKIKLKYDKVIVSYFVKVLPAFAATGILVKILNSIDTVILRNLTSNHLVGLYSIPLKLITVLSLTVPAALMAVLYPAFSNLYHQSQELLAKAFRKSVEYLLIISIPISFGFLALGDEIIRGLWRSDYLAALPAAKIMLFSVPFLFLAFPTGNLLNAVDRQKWTTLSRLIGVLTLVSSELILIPQFRLLGAAFALLITQTVIFGYDFYFVTKVIKDRVVYLLLFKTMLKVLLSSLVMFLLLQILSTLLPWYVLILAGVVVYLAVLTVVKGVDFAFLRKMTKGF
jgi:O-antigen/teichoic acid export membrane protein